MRNIPDNNFGYPVLITLDNGSSGSGFLLSTRSDIYFITAKHVLFDPTGMLRADSANLILQSGNINDDSISEASVDFTALIIGKNLYKHDSADIAAFKFGTCIYKEDGIRYTLLPGDGVTLIKQGNGEIISVDTSIGVKLLNNVMISNDIFLYGYPSSLGLKKLPQFDFTKPLLRKGIIASVNKIQKTIILDCPVYYGNSGGPVVQVNHTDKRIEHQVVGVVSQFIPYAENWINQSNGITHTEISNSGYSVATSMDFVYELLNIPAPVPELIHAV